jgi:hypothetical protein
VEDIGLVGDIHLGGSVAVAVQVGGSHRSSAQLVEAGVTEPLKLLEVTWTS